MQKNINKELLNNDPNSKILIELLETNEMELEISNSILHYEFPFYVDEDNNSLSVNILLISQVHGVILFIVSDITSRSIDDVQISLLIGKLEKLYSQLYSKLFKSSLLRKDHIHLAIKVTPLIYLTHDAEKEKFKQVWNDLEIASDYSDLKRILNGLKVNDISKERYNETIAIIEGTKGVINAKGKVSRSGNNNSKGKVLDEVETDIAVFDDKQKDAALLIIDKPQRIRGLAGSGKTIVLTMKAALLHLKYPSAEILYTFYTKSLYGNIKNLISKFYKQFSENEPDFDKIHILHAWGGHNLPGVYYNTCVINNITPMSLEEARRISMGYSRKGNSAFDSVCKILYENDLKEYYDYTILDEAQDFPTFFYRLCRKITKSNKIIWGYDECQNILDINLQDTKETFGKDKDGNYYIDFSNLPNDSLQDIVLHKCYRNPRKILIAAFALGLGIYNHRILQLPENNEHWQDFGFEIVQGSSTQGDKMIITRPAENSPLMKNKLLEGTEIIRYAAFENIYEECDYVTNCIQEDIENGLLREDILIISLDDYNSRIYFDYITTKLLEEGIRCFNLLRAPSTTQVFFVKDSITLSTVYRAKGNEAGSVYIIGTDFVFRNRDLITERNKLFTAITRARAWVTMTGLKQFMNLCIKELELTLGNYPNLIFEMPNKQDLRIFQRDLSKGQAQLNKIERELEKLAEKLGVDKEYILEQLKGRAKKAK